MTEKNFRPLKEYREYPLMEMKIRATEFYSDMKRRRSIRQFSDRAVTPTGITRLSKKYPFLIYF